MDIEQRVSTAFSSMALQEPFVAAVMTKIKRQYNDYGGRVKTAATDGQTLWFNPEFVEPLTQQQLFGLALHESLHVILLHTWRIGDRDPHLWNIAADAVINRYIVSRNYKLPDNPVLFSWVTDEMDAEFVYNKLKQEQDEQPQQGAGFGEGEGDIFPAPSGTDLHDMEATIVAAATAAKVCGKGNGLVERVLNSVTASNTDWRNELRAMMTSSARSDYSYRRFSKRFVSNGLYLPSLYSEELGGVLIGIDTSGSMGQRELDIIAADVQQIFDDLQPEYIEVVYCDSSINKVQRFERGDDIKLVVCGGGGTRFKPVFDHIYNMEHPPVGMIYFTDMYGDLKECDDPNIPMIWANLGGSRVEQPFGVMVNVQI